MKTLRNIALLFLLAIAGWWLLGRFELLPSLGNIFRPKNVEIEQTPLVIEQIRPLKQLVTIVAYTEAVADSTVRTTIGERLKEVFNPFTLGVKQSRQLVVVGAVTIQAGVDLSKLQPGDLFVSGDSISLQLPAAEILDAVINPSGTDIFLAEGTWDNVAIVNLKKEVRQKAVNEMLARGVLYQAETKARDVLLNFFRVAGFQKITINKTRLG